MQNNKVYSLLGASNHSNKERVALDFYATDPMAIDRLANAVQLPNVIWEPCCGQGHLSKRLSERGHTVISTDIVNRGYGQGGVDFFAATKMPNNCECILTNPPYNKAERCIIHALDLLPPNGQCFMFVRTLFIESESRYRNIFSLTPPKFIYQFVRRVRCAANGDFEHAGSPAQAFCWMRWIKGYNSDTILKWI